MVGLVALCLAGALILVLQLGTDEGTVEVISVPEGAQISFDNRVFTRTAPAVIPVTDLQRPHIVEVRLANYQIWRRQITLTEEDTHVRVLAVLTPIYGKLEVRSLPMGADVYIAGEHRGKTPLTISNLLPSEDIKLELRKKGFRPATRILKWEGQNYLLSEITLTPSR